jgi:hypothetical protein
MQFTNEKNDCFRGKMGAKRADIAYNWEVPAVLRNLARECFKIRDYLL